MAPRAAAKKLTQDKYLQKLYSPKIDLYVGKKRKYYSLPRDLLIHYSGYFARYFDSIKQEGSGAADKDTIYLLNDDADDFALIVGYIYRGSVISSLPEANEMLKMARCLKFINFIGKLEMGEAGSVIYPVLREILVESARSQNPTACLSPEFIRTAFEVIPKGNEVLKLLCQAAMPESLKRKEGKFAKVVEEVDGFAAETWRQFQEARGEMGALVPLRRTAQQ